MSRTIEFDFSKWGFNIQERARGRMKLMFKLNKEESEGFKAFEETVKPQGVTQQDFVKTIFLTGVQEINRQFSEAAKKYVEEAKKQKEEEAEKKTKNTLKDTGDIKVYDNAEKSVDSPDEKE